MTSDEGTCSVGPPTMVSESSLLTVRKDVTSALKGVPKQAYTQHHNAVVRSVALLPDVKCRSIVYGFSDGTIQLSRADGHTKKVEADGPVWVVAVSNDSRYIVSGGEDGTITVWNSNLDMQQKIRSTSSREKITALNVSPDSATGERIRRRRGQHLEHHVGQMPRWTSGSASWPSDMHPIFTTGRPHRYGGQL